MTQKFTKNARSLLVGGISAAKAVQQAATKAKAAENLVGEP